MRDRNKACRIQGWMWILNCVGSNWKIQREIHTKNVGFVVPSTTFVTIINIRYGKNTYVMLLGCIHNIKFRSHFNVFISFIFFYSVFHYLFSSWNWLLCKYLLERWLYRTCNGKDRILCNVYIILFISCLSNNSAHVCEDICRNCKWILLLYTMYACTMWYRNILCIQKSTSLVDCKYFITADVHFSQQWFFSFWILI